MDPLLTLSSHSQRVFTNPGMESRPGSNHAWRVMELRLAGVLFLVVLLALGCQKKQGGAGGPPMGAFAVQVVTAPVRTEPVVETVSLVGNVMANEIIDLTSETDGIVKEIRFGEGTPVKKGDVLVILDDTKLAPQVQEAEAQLQLARTSFERVKLLFRDKLISQQEYDTAAATYSANEASVDLKRRMLRDARILAPFSGIAGARQISPGQVITRSTRITQLVDLDTVKVEVAVPERYLSQVQEGQKVRFRVAAFPKDTFEGEVYFVSPQLDPNTRTALVKARIANPSRRLRGGMFANLELSLQLRDAALVIPESAVFNNGDATLVFLATSTNTAMIQPVRTGLRLAGKVEVLQGLADGQSVVTEGLQKLRPGAPIMTRSNGPATAPKP
ncbi:MAG: efflux RND transporter periplasmic adaptor subunit [Verrucomicrobia bacterium]|nr:efflux RND transporter periplasmic adaptor subunit [Verrucomicrobiota bacterium]